MYYYKDEEESRKKIFITNPSCAHKGVILYISKQATQLITMLH